MDLITLIITAFALSADAFAASLSCGCTMDDFKHNHCLTTALFFGAFQGIMPLAGWLGASLFRDSWLFFNGHWVSLALLFFIGGKMIWESLHPDGECADPDEIFGLKNMLILAVATSIDALAVGASLAFLGSTILAEAVIIALITFGVSYAGVHAGHRLSHLFGERMETVGGSVLLLIGIKIVMEHYGILF
ncbi:MAG: manganese efflux pump MntP family protein [Spirochaetales bacterium]|nr:manganese efflux pump MntP family protein [Spirochaetales bacterium]